MIEKMHDRSNGPVFKVIFALVSLSFVLGGIGTGLMSHDTSAVKVNGEEISQQYFSQARTQEQNYRNAQEGEKFWEKLEDPAYAQQFQTDIFNRLITEQLLRQYAQGLKLGISSDQVKSEIVNTAMFHQDGKFNNSIYQQFLRNNGISPDQYASIVADGMLMSQLQEGIINSDFSVPAQQNLLAKLLLQQRQVRLATYPLVAEMANQTASDAEAQTFFEAHKTQFLSPEKLTVEYLQFSPKNVEAKIQVDNAQIETYYQTNKANYVSAGESHFAHIQVASEADANTVLQALQNGENFAKLAAEKSLDTGSAKTGGDLGWTKAGTFPKAFEEAANVLQVGQVSGVVKVDNSFHIIKLLDRKAAKELTLDQVKDQIANTIRRELVLSEYNNTAREMARKAGESSSLDEVAQLAGITVQKTATFTPDTLPAELQNEKVSKIVLSDLRKNGQNSEAIELGEANNPHIMFVRVSQYQPESQQSFEDAKNAVLEAVKLEKASAALTAKAESDLKALNDGTATSVKFGESQSLIYAQAQVQQPLLAQTVFAMPKPTDKPNYQVLKANNGNMVIVALDKISDGNPTEFSGIAAQFAQADRAVLLDTLVKDLRDRAKVEINQDFAEQQLNGNLH